MSKSETVRFGVAVRDGEDEDKGNEYYEIGPLEIDGKGEIMPEGITFITLRNPAESEERYPGIQGRRMQTAQHIANALTEYAAKYSLTAGDFPE